MYGSAMAEVVTTTPRDGSRPHAVARILHRAPGSVVPGHRRPRRGARSRLRWEYGGHLRLDRTPRRAAGRRRRGRLGRGAGRRVLARCVRTRVAIPVHELRAARGLRLRQDRASGCPIMWWRAEIPMHSLGLQSGSAGRELSGSAERRLPVLAGCADDAGGLSGWPGAIRMRFL